jgi:hypothetical protein
MHQPDRGFANAAVIKRTGQQYNAVGGEGTRWAKGVVDVCKPLPNLSCLASDADRLETITGDNQGKEVVGRE